MKTMLLASCLAVAVSSAIAAPNDAPAPSTPAPAAKQPTVSASSHVTVTIESGGKKETHEIDLGSAPTLKVHGKDTVTIASSSEGKSSSATGGTPPSEPQNLILTPGTLTLNSLTFQNKSGPTPWLGVTIEPVSDELRAQLPIEKGAGLILKSIVPDGPAARAGLQKNDVLVKLDDQLLVNGNQLSALVQMKKDGDKVGLTYYRGGKSSTAEAQIQVHQEDYTGTTFVSGGTLTVNSGPVGNSPATILNGGTLTFNSDPVGNSPATKVDKDGHVVSTDLGEMVVVDKDGHVLITKTQPDLTAVTAQVEKILRAAGVDDKTITQTELAIAEAAKAAGNAASSIGNANAEVARQIEDATDQVAKSLEKARAETDRARKQAEEARDRLEKQANPKRTPEAQ